MTDLGPLKYFLGIYVTRNTFGMFLSQTQYATEMFERAHMLTCNSCQTLVDIYSKLAADADHAALSFIQDHREPHLSAPKRVLRYIWGTLDYGLQLYSSSISSLVAYLDVNWAGCLTTRMSTSGIGFSGQQ
ncbi:ribonuclease H-like domain-containing protein [Tanacetum coccineum]